jgi:hypothetical protein
MPPEELLSGAERVARADIAARRAIREEMWRLKRRAEGHSLPGIDPLAGYIDPGLKEALNIERRRKVAKP